MEIFLPLFCLTFLCLLVGVAGYVSLRAGGEIDRCVKLRKDIEKYLYERKPNRCKSCYRKIDFKRKGHSFCDDECLMRYQQETTGDNDGIY